MTFNYSHLNVVEFYKLLVKLQTLILDRTQEEDWQNYNWVSEAIKTLEKLEELSEKVLHLDADSEEKESFLRLRIHLTSLENVKQDIEQYLKSHARLTPELRYKQLGLMELVYKGLSNILRVQLEEFPVIHSEKILLSSVISDLQQLRKSEGRNTHASN
tara:strand:- start:501 stop:977 length:477 start_codon:yes stop_codon:yes gene_type:complete